MDLEEIKIKKSIIHVLDSDHRNLTLSNKLIQYGSDFQDFLISQILKVYGGDDSKYCEFRDESEVEKMLKNETDFVIMSQKIAKHLYSLMERYSKIPSADLIVLEFNWKGSFWLALLKVNFITTYTHKIEDEVNQVVTHSNAFPRSATTKLDEAVLINLENYSLHVREKKFEVEGIKGNYFSGLFLKCRGELPEKTKIQTVKNALDFIRDKFISDEIERTQFSMKGKAAIADQYKKNGAIDIKSLTDSLFEEKEEDKHKFLEILKRHYLVNKKILPQNDSTVEKVCTHKITTECGIKIIIPMVNLNDKRVEFYKEKNGEINLVIKNIGRVKNN